MEQVSTQAMTLPASRRWHIFLHALLFVAGFSLVFVVGWGGTASLLGQLFSAVKPLIARIGGVIVVLFGLATMGVVRLPLLYYMDTRPQYQGRTGNYFTSGLIGIFFGAGWSPCIGATLGAILTLGLNGNTVWQAMGLASAYSLGLGIPFLAMALGLERASGWVKRLRRYQRAFQIASGILMIAIGLLLITNWMSLIAIWAFKNQLYLDVSFFSIGVPSFLTAIIAGLLSFFSPCVLPLVPGFLGYLSGHALKSYP